MRHLVVVSNRLPFAVKRGPKGPEFVRAPGGLVAALEPVLSERGGMWVGWNGVSGDDGEDFSLAAPPGPAGVEYRPVPLAAREVSRYYEGFSNRTLWPLFHFFVGRTQIDGRTWRAYETINQRFAEATADAADASAQIWVHDYQLLRVPFHLRQIDPGRRIALFLHIPFPASDVFRILPWARDLMRGMLSADLVGFQVPTYVGHFMSCAERLLGCELDRTAGTILYDGRTVSVQAHPISIDVAQFEVAARTDPATARPPGVARVLGVDRLDYTKGIHERLLAIDRLLDSYPEHRGKVVFTQLLVPSRERVAEYGALKRQLDEAVGRINGRWSERGWSPIRYLVRSLPPDELAALYHQADVALVTPLRDGMNLVAKEYVAAQIESDGVLVLSELAGAAEELQEAVLVNPFDVDAVAAALHHALTMPRDERHARMSALRDRVRTRDVHAWVRGFLEAAEVADAASRRADRATPAPIDVLRTRLAPWLAERPAVALFLDYDGTLTAIAPKPALATLPDAARQALQRAASAPNLDVVIVSGRSLEDVRNLIRLPGLTYVGNHGFEIEGPGLSYRHEGVGSHQGMLDRAADELERMGVAGAWVERKGATLSYHLRDAADEARATAERRARSILRRRGLRVVEGKRTLEGRPPLDWHKGHAVLYVLRERHGENWPARTRAVYVGDDVTDEDAFRSLRGIGRSIRVGPPADATAADYQLPDPSAVLQLVRWFASGGFRVTP